MRKKKEPCHTKVGYEQCVWQRREGKNPIPKNNCAAGTKDREAEVRWQGGPDRPAAKHFVLLNGFSRAFMTAIEHGLTNRDREAEGYARAWSTPATRTHGIVAQMYQADCVCEKMRDPGDDIAPDR